MQMYMYIEIEIKIKIKMQIKDGYGDAAADHNTTHGDSFFMRRAELRLIHWWRVCRCVLCVMCCDVL